MPYIQNNSDSIRITSPQSNDENLSISICGPYELLSRIKPSIYPFLPISILNAMIKGENIFVDAYIDDQWLINLNSSFMPLMRALFDIGMVSIEKKKRAVNNIWYNLPTLFDNMFHKLRLSNEAVGLMFSAGIDSFYSLSVMQRNGVTPNYLINVNAGAHDYNDKCWHRRLVNIKELAARMNIPLITIDTNFHEIIAMPHIRTHVIRNISAVLSLTPLSNFVYSSAHAFRDISFDSAKAYGIDYLDHAVISSMKPKRTEIYVLGWDADRVEKTAVVAKNVLAHRHLDVCTDQTYQANSDVDSPMNCGRCAKCVRTMLTLDALGALESFSSRFPLDRYRRERSNMIEWVKTQSHPLDQAAAKLWGKAQSNGVTT